MYDKSKKFQCREVICALISGPIELGVWNGSEVVYDDSDEELADKVREIIDKYSK